MSFLENINSPDDIKKLSLSELYVLSDEIREFLVNNVSKTGGHLASNLGIVELTLAIHKVFDTSKDRLIFDVGHQSYVHKIITGRKGSFSGLRKFGGMSGFSRPDESIHDACVSGHASNSVSVALGMARARTLKKENYSVISVIGDGALTGGLAYEGMSDAGQSREPMIVILNDNEMSITKNVGAMTDYLAKLRLRPRYLHFKDKYRKIIKKTKLGVAFDNAVHGIKDAFKNAFLPSSWFEDMGFTYLGPADGHDLKYIIYLLELAKDLNRPVVIHLMTRKGKGYELSEQNPEDYHGVGKFDVREGISSEIKAETFSSVFGDEITRLAEKENRICAITAAMPSGVGLSDFAERFPDRFFDVAIAEEHAVSMAAGLASQGMIPVCAIYSTFLQRAYDMVLHDVAISKLHVVFAVDRAGIVGQDGETHHGVFDVSFLSDVPGMRILAPSNFAELRGMLDYAVKTDGPVAVRYGRGGEGIYKENSFINTSKSRVLTEGNDITIISYGIYINNALAAASILKKSGISAKVLKLNSIKPIDSDAILGSAARTGRVAVVEDVVEHGSVYETVCTALEKSNICCKVIGINSGDKFTTHGEFEKLITSMGLTGESIAKRILEECSFER